METLNALLLADRHAYNQRFRLAKHRYPTLSPESFSQALQLLLAPLVERLPPDGRADVVAQLYEILLELVARKLLGPEARSPWITQVWQELLPLTSVHLAKAPRKVAAALSNAAWNIGNAPDARPEKWLLGMKALAGSCENPDILLACGQIQAWRHGLAWMRPGVLPLWYQLPEALKALALSVDPAPTQILSEDLKNPWIRPGKCPRRWRLALRAVGGFRGFSERGGLFLSPPKVSAHGGRLFVHADTQSWGLDADCFGATLKRAETPILASDALSHWSLDGQGRVQYQGLSEVFPALHHVSSMATTPHTFAITLKHSFKVFIVARVGADGG